MTLPDPASCCPDAYLCTATDRTVCPRHHTDERCSPEAHEHISMDTEAWNRAHDRIEEALLDAVLRHSRNTANRTVPNPALAGVLDDVLGVTTASTLDAVHAVTPCPIG